MKAGKAARDDAACKFPAGEDGSTVLQRLVQVPDPEVDESILDLGLVRSLQLRSGHASHASFALRLPTNSCAVLSRQERIWRDLRAAGRSIAVS